MLSSHKSIDKLKLILLISILDNMRAACGLGMAFKIGGRARIELNYCVPLSKQKTDKARPAFQFGIGYEFLWIVTHCYAFCAVGCVLCLSGLANCYEAEKASGFYLLSEKCCPFETLEWIARSWWSTQYEIVDS